MKNGERKYSIRFLSIFLIFGVLACMAVASPASRRRHRHLRQSHSSSPSYGHNPSSIDPSLPGAHRYSRAQDKKLVFESSLTNRNPVLALKILGDSPIELADQKEAHYEQALKVLDTEVASHPRPFQLLLGLDKLADDLDKQAKGDERILDRIATLEDRCRAMSLAWTTELTSAGAWDKAAKWINERHDVLKELDDELGELFAKVNNISQELKDLRDHEARLSRPLTAAELALWENDHPQFLLPGHRQAATALAALVSLKGVAESKWNSPPNVVAIKGQINDLVTNVPAQREVAIQLQHELAFKSLLAGYPVEASQLLPETNSPQLYAAFLRDLKVLAIQDGSVHTWPAQQALSKAASSRQPSVRGPPGLSLLVPHDDPQSGTRPTIQESVLVGLPTLEFLDQAKTVLAETTAAGEKHFHSLALKDFSELRDQLEGRRVSCVRRLWMARYCQARLQLKSEVTYIIDRQRILDRLLENYSDPRQSGTSQDLESVVDWFLSSPDWKVVSSGAASRVSMEGVRSYNNGDRFEMGRRLAQLADEYGWGKTFEPSDLLPPNDVCGRPETSEETGQVVQLEMIADRKFNPAERQVIVSMLRAKLAVETIREMVTGGCLKADLNMAASEQAE